MSEVENAEWGEFTTPHTIDPVILDSIDNGDMELVGFYQPNYYCEPTMKLRRKVSLIQPWDKTKGFGRSNGFSDEGSKRI